MGRELQGWAEACGPCSVGSREPPKSFKQEIRVPDPLISSMNSRGQDEHREKEVAR